MPDITRIDAWAFGGATYKTEKEALAAVIATKAKIGFAVALGLLDCHADIIPILQRYHTLTETPSA